jgi:hypothetical protein
MRDLFILFFIIFSVMAVDLASKVAGRERIMPIFSLFKTHFFAKFLNNPKKSVTHTHTLLKTY